MNQSFRIITTHPLGFSAAVILSAVLMLCGACSSPVHVRDANRIVNVADSMDACHSLYTDTTSLRYAICTLDKPVSRLIYHNSLAAAYYYMGRNLNAENAIADAADCYIACDRCHSDNPIRRGRVNACMAYICCQHQEDSLALIFYKRSSYAFRESRDEWYYAHSLLNVSRCYNNLHQYLQADSVWKEACAFRLDSAFHARLLETRGLYFYEQQRYDSALHYFLQMQEFLMDVETKCFACLKVVQCYHALNDSQSAFPYAQYIIAHSHNPNYLSNAYYMTIKQAEQNGDIEQVVEYSHQREDNSRLLAQRAASYAQAVLTLQSYVNNPHPFLVWKLGVVVVFSICIVLICTAYIARKRRRLYTMQADEQLQAKDSLLLRQADTLCNHQNTIHELSQIVSTNRAPEVMTFLEHLRSTYPQPDKSWLNYSNLKKSISPTLLCLSDKLQQMQLSEKEITLCLCTLIYNSATLNQLADYLYYSQNSIRTMKKRIARKLGLSNASSLYQFLLDLAIYGTPIEQLK